MMRSIAMIDYNRWAVIAARQEESTIITLPKASPDIATIRDPLLPSSGMSSDSFDYAAAPVVHTGISVNGSSR
jgi:hypothetical protein